MTHDLVIRGGTIVDGTGGTPFQGDIAIDNGLITAVGTVESPGREEIDATGKIVTPGFVDVHTHYDGQATWDAEMAPSSWHGVTTVIMGNCGVGFAPARPDRHDWLISLMEGGEDIPGTALAEGMKWDWETFPEYLDALERLPRTVDVGTHVPHGAVRAYVLGDREKPGAVPTEAEIAEMSRIVEEGIRAGALGFSTSRTVLHKSVDGELVPGTTATAEELIAIGRAMGRVGHGVFEMASDLTREWVTSLPPSVFSVGRGVRLTDAAALVISQSGASDDLVRSARGAKGQGARVLAITNVPASPVESESHLTLPIAAGPERAVPATKTVVGAIAAGMALIGALAPAYRPRARADAATLAALAPIRHPREAAIVSALLRANHVYVIGRDTGYGAAQELALKLKETCALHAEAYSSSEVLHGPLQLVTRPLLILILDTGQPEVQQSLDTAEARFRQAGGEVIRIRPADIAAPQLTPAGAAALLLCLLYPVVLATAVALGHDPDAPATLSKVTQTT